MTPRAAVAFAAFLLASQALARVGLSTQVVDVVVEGLRPGGVYALRELRGAPYAVKNRGDARVEVILESVPPSVLAPRYEAIPDPAWVELTPSRLLIEPGTLGISEVVIRVPDDPALVGRHFQATILAQTVKTGLIGTGVKSRLRFSVGPAPETLDFEVTPAELTLTKAKAGGVYDGAKEERRRFRIENKTNVELRVALKAARWEGPLPGAGWEAPADLSWVRFEPPLAVLGAFGSAEVRLVLDGAPASLTGRQAAFLVEARLTDGAVVGPARRAFVRFPLKKRWLPWLR